MLSDVSGGLSSSSQSILIERVTEADNKSADIISRKDQKSRLKSSQDNCDNKRPIISEEPRSLDSPSKPHS